MPRVRSRESRMLGGLIMMRHVQWKYIIVVLGMCMLSALGLMLLIWRYSERVSEALVNEAQAVDTALANWLTAELDQAWTMVILLSLAGAFLLTVFLLVMTHRFAAPLASAQRHFERLSIGLMTEPPEPRSLDLLNGFTSSIGRAQSGLQKRWQEQSIIAEALLASDVNYDKRQRELLEKLCSDHAPSD